MTAGVATAVESDLDRVALEKLTRVLGEPIGRRIYQETLEELGLTGIGTPDELYAFGGALAKRGGFEAAIGGLISVAAVMRGATRG